MNPIRFASVAAATLLAAAAHAQIVYSATFVTNPDQWGAFAWQDANGTLNFTNGYLSFSTTGSDPYVGSYGPSGVPPWGTGFAPLNIAPLFGPLVTPTVTFEARASAPDGGGINFELQAPSFPDMYVFSSAPLTTDWQTFTITSYSTAGSPLPFTAEVIAFGAGRNIGTVDIRNLVVEAVIPEPSTYVALSAALALGAVLLRRRRVS